jgi:hypothetical protein
MDSKLIYQASEHMQGKVKWIKLTDTEWVYCGTDQEIDRELLITNINSHITSSICYVAYTRKESIETIKEEVLNAIGKLIGLHNFSIWDAGFINTIEFNHIGVFRKGTVIT